MSLAAALSTYWSPSRRHAGAPASRLSQRSTLEVTDFAAPISNDLMQILMRRSWRKQCPTVHTTWCLMDRSDSSRKPRSRTVVKGLTKAYRHSAHWCQDGYTVCGSHTTGSQTSRD